MFHIVICIPTYKRPQGLQKLLGSIAQCSFDPALLKRIEIVVVDNDAERSALAVVEQFKTEWNGRLPVYYYSYLYKGLAHVRNELLRKALALQPDFIVFVDDDEYVTPAWLLELVHTILHNQSDSARGPVIAKLSEQTPPAISWFFRRESFRNNEQLSTWTTGNLIIRRESLQRHNIWFDHRFNRTGSEDGYFGVQMSKKGATIHWAANAVAYEVIPKSRANLRWLVKRTFRLSSTFVYILLLEKQYIRLGRKLLVSGLYILLGLPALLLTALPGKRKYWGVVKLAEGAGGFAGLLTIRYPEYK